MQEGEEGRKVLPGDSHTKGRGERGCRRHQEEPEQKHVSEKFHVAAPVRTSMLPKSSSVSSQSQQNQSTLLALEWEQAA